jgi:hypothetical protein
MKKTFFKVGALAICAMLAPVFTSCGSDDDDEPFGRPDVPSITEPGGISGNETYVRLTSLGGLPIYYDNQGRVEGVGNYLDIDYSRGKILMEGQEMNIKFNGKGYIKEISGAWDYEDDGDRYKGSGKMEFKYTGDGNLIEYKLDSTEIEYEDRDKTYYEEGVTYKCKWQHGNLVRVDGEVYEKEDGETERYNESFIYRYGDRQNKFFQMPLSVTEYLLDADELSVLAAAGLFGYGPANLPSGGVESDDDGYESSFSVRFTLNNNGSIAREIFDNSSVSWDYGEYTRGMFVEQLAAKKHSVRSIFVRSAKRAK